MTELELRVRFATSTPSIQNIRIAPSSTFKQLLAVLAEAGRLRQGIKVSVGFPPTVLKMKLSDVIAGKLQSMDTLIVSRDDVSGQARAPPANHIRSAKPSSRIASPPTGGPRIATLSSTKKRSPEPEAYEPSDESDSDDKPRQRRRKATPKTSCKRVRAMKLGASEEEVGERFVAATARHARARERLRPHT